MKKKLNSFMCILALSLLCRVSLEVKNLQVNNIWAAGVYMAAENDVDNDSQYVLALAGAAHGARIGFIAGSIGGPIAGLVIGSAVGL